MIAAPPNPKVQRVDKREENTAVANELILLVLNPFADEQGEDWLCRPLCLLTRIGSKKGTRAAKTVQSRDTEIPSTSGSAEVQARIRRTVQ